MQLKSETSSIEFDRAQELQSDKMVFEFRFKCDSNVIQMRFAYLANDYVLFVFENGAEYHGDTVGFGLNVHRLIVAIVDNGSFLSFLAFFC